MDTVRVTLHTIEGYAGRALNDFSYQSLADVLSGGRCRLPHLDAGDDVTISYTLIDGPNT